MVIKNINPVRQQHDRTEPAAESSRKSRRQERHEAPEGSAPAKKASAVPKSELLEAVDNANEIGQLLKRKLNFTIDRETDRIVVEVVDEETGEVVRQVPPEEMLRISAHLKKLLAMNEQVMYAVKSVILDVTA
jgi:flagellar protein FlaG